MSVSNFNVADDDSAPESAGFELSNSCATWPFPSQVVHFLDTDVLDACTDFTSLATRMAMFSMGQAGEELGKREQALQLYRSTEVLAKATGRPDLEHGAAEGIKRLSG